MDYVQGQVRRVDSIGRASSALMQRYWVLVLGFLLCVGGASGYYQWGAVQRNVRALLLAYAGEYAARLEVRMDGFHHLLAATASQLQASSDPVVQGAVMQGLLRRDAHFRAVALLDARGRPLRMVGDLQRYPAQDKRLSPLTRAAWRGCPGDSEQCVAPPVLDGRPQQSYLVANLWRLRAVPGGARWLVVVRAQVHQSLLRGLREPYPDAAILALRTDDHLLQMRNPAPSRRDFGFAQTGVLVHELGLHPKAWQGTFVGTPTAVANRVLGVYVRRPDLPFVIAVNVPLSTVYTTWLRAMAPILGALLGSALLGTVLLRRGLRGLRDAEVARELTHDALREQIRFNKDLALRDALTGLLNRRGMDGIVAEALQQARASARGFGMILFDLDRFKVLNDSYGHQAGDEVLRAVASLLRRQLRPQDAAARWGGEEFLLLLPDLDAKQTEQVAERLRTAIADEVVVHRGQAIHLTASFGVAAWDGPGCTSERLLSRLDSLLYDAKRSGRNQVRHAHAHQGASLSMGSRLQMALQQQRLRVAYQPLVDLRSGQVVGHEALARVLGSDGEVLDAASFIDAAHSLRLEHCIDQVVSRQALARCVCRARDGEPTVKQMINCSADFLSRPELVRDLLDGARRACAGLSPAMVPWPKPMVIEITESQLLGNLQETREMLQPLVDFGFELAVDDFGSGYSSFLYLLDLPVRYLKIDKELVQRAVLDARARAMVESIRGMASGLGLITVAEGIETQQCFELMRRLGVDWGQGFLWGRPEIA
jgi:diguanylate cyclase (GGDEF)-like protein